jgi:hypothetical protein
MQFESCDAQRAAGGQLDKPDFNLPSDLLTDRSVEVPPWPSSIP